MPTTRINCPNCRQPITADIDQLFDVAQDPSAKQRLLSGAFNIIQCPHCGYQGMVATPIIYHDPDKELLLTYFPPELNLPVQEQEKQIGPMIKRVVDNLAQEKRKGYLFRPQTMLTLQGLVERVLEGEGITKEMIQAQQERLNLLQRLLRASGEDVIKEIAKQDDRLMDETFFGMLNQLIEAAMAQGDQEGVNQLTRLQKTLYEVSTTGKQIAEQSKEVEAAIHTLQQAGRELTREKLLDLFLEAPSETRVDVMASLARPALDYEFFQLLSERIEKSGDQQRERLEHLRERLLEVTREVDRQVEARSQQSRELLKNILEADDVTEATQQSLQVVDEFFVQALNDEVAQARKKGDLERIARLQEVNTVLQQASAPPPEIALLEELLEVEDEKAQKEWMEAHQEQITPELIDMVMSLMSRAQDQDADLQNRLQKAYKALLRFSMEKNLRA